MMPTRSQSSAIPANAKVITSVQIASPAATLTVTHLKASVRRVEPVEWVQYTRRLRDGSTKKWAEQRTGRSAAKIPAEFAEMVRDSRADGHKVTILAGEVTE